MARQSSDAVPVMDAEAETKTAKPRATAKPTARTLSGPYGASFDGEGTKGLTFERRWTTPGRPSLRRDHLGDSGPRPSATSRGKIVFEQKDVEVPNFWSQLATNVVVSKYFRGHVGTPERETSVSS